MKRAGCDYSVIREVSARIHALEHGTKAARTPALHDEACSPGLLPTQQTTAPLPYENHERVSIGNPGIFQDTTASSTVSWGRHYGACYPHRTCLCYRLRDRCEITSINSDLSQKEWIPLHPDYMAYPTPTAHDARKLMHLHVNHLLWHHNSIHAPTFLLQCERYWDEGVCDHPLWFALYLAVLSVLNTDLPV